MPPNPHTITAPIDLVVGFRIASVLTVSVFWLLLGVFLGWFWDKEAQKYKYKVATTSTSL